MGVFIKEADLVTTTADEVYLLVTLTHSDTVFEECPLQTNIFHLFKGLIPCSLYLAWLGKDRNEEKQDQEAGSRFAL